MRVAKKAAFSAVLQQFRDALAEGPTGGTC
jgi:hypothetical protein